MSRLCHDMTNIPLSSRLAQTPPSKYLGAGKLSEHSFNSTFATLVQLFKKRVGETFDPRVGARNMALVRELRDLNSNSAARLSQATFFGGA